MSANREAEVPRLNLYMSARAQTLQAWGWDSGSISTHLQVPIAAVEAALREPDPFDEDYEA